MALFRCHTLHLLSRLLHFHLKSHYNADECKHMIPTFFTPFLTIQRRVILSCSFTINYFFFQQKKNLTGYRIFFMILSSSAVLIDFYKREYPAIFIHFTSLNDNWIKYFYLTWADTVFIKSKSIRNSDPRISTHLVSYWRVLIMFYLTENVLLSSSL